jgi:hypothetical protein
MASNVYSDTSRTGEPSLDEMLADPIIKLIMHRDGVNDDDMRGQIDRIRNAFGAHATVQ